MNGLLKRAAESGDTYEMIYMSDKNDISQRTIQVIDVSGGRFRAYCYLRKTQRIFKISNVLSMGPIKKYERGA
jgi:predicted DNA-binding transcriptional regulator YafY